MSLKNLVETNRSYRRFHQEVPIDRSTLEELVDLARLSASGANLQPLKYILGQDAETNAKIFELLGWAGYLSDWPGPSEGERPSAYIVVLGDTAISKSFGVDHGIAVQSMLLGAVEKGLGGCIIATVKRPELAVALAIPTQFEILLVVALGKPKETVQIDSLPADGDIKYWRDDSEVHHVPKRSLDELIIR